MTMYRQGDVLLVKVTATPDGLKEMPKQPSNKTVLAFGEVTGHHHRFEDGRVLSFSKEGDDLTMSGGPVAIKNLPYAFVGEPTQVEAVVIPPGGADLIHEEHSAIHVEAGTYKVVRQVEYVAPAIVRQVID